MFENYQTTMAKHAAALIKNDINLAHKRVILWLDNEKAGSKASESVARATGFLPPLIVRCIQPMGIIWGITI